MLEAVSQAKRPRVRPASFEDYDQIAAVQAANGLAPKPRAQWLHLWQDNPAYRRSVGWPIGWVLEDNQGRVVGTVANIPGLYRFEGRAYVGAFGRGWAVDVGHRGHALELMARHTQQTGVDLLVTNTASARTADLLTRRGWSQVPVGRWDRSALWMTSYARTLQRCVATDGPWACFLAAVLLSLPRRLKDAVSRRFRPPEAGCELRWRNSFGEAFDQFWTELEAQNPHRLLAVRDRETLDWHFKYALEENRILILTASQASRLVAYAIFEYRQIRSLNLPRLLLVDFQTLRNDPDLVAAMLSFAFERCRQENVEVLENMGCWLEATQPLAERPPLHRHLGNWSYVYRAPNPELATRLQDPKSWYPTQYEADACL